MQAVQKIITRDRHRDLEGMTVEVLTEGISKNSRLELTGRTRSNKIVNFDGSPDLVGQLLKVEITKGYANSLKGKRV